MTPDIQKLKARAEALEGHVLTLANTRMHLDMSQWSEISNAVLDARSTILALIEENERLAKLIRVLIENEPNDIVADGGHTVLDEWRYRARAALKETTDV